MNSKENKIDESLSTVALEGRPRSGIRRKLYIIIFEAETKWGKRFDVALLWAILFSVVLVVLESEKSINLRFETFFFIAEWFLTIFFTIEYVMRLWVTKRPVKYAKSFFGLIDLGSILPSYLGLIFPGAEYLKVIRGLRLLRVFRILKLPQFVNASEVLKTALLASRHKIYIFFGAVLTMVLIMGTVMYIIEGEESGFRSIPVAVYWAIVTVTTVGYGDLVPVTVLGKTVASFMMLMGYAILAVPTGIVSTEISIARKGRLRISSKPSCQRCKAELIEKSNFCHVCAEKVDSKN